MGGGVRLTGQGRAGQGNRVPREWEIKGGLWRNK